MIDVQVGAAVPEVIRRIVAEEVVPRRRRLAEHEVLRKTGPDDLVTIADREVERRLTEELTALLPGSKVVGEEGVHEDPGRYAALEGEDPVWIVDPVDGTRQFVRGEPGFCTLVALARAGRVLGAWLYAPVPDLFAEAWRGAGVRLNGAPLPAPTPRPWNEPLRVACSDPDHVAPDQRRALLGLWTEGVAPRPGGAAGLEYLRVARGELDALAFSWEFPWDHAAGLLLVTEAGGVQRTVAGEPFRLAGGNALPFTAARDEATARRILDLLAAGRTDAV
ncbi:inositol monophosphatase family protein [Streptomyces sp. ST2-7A]|uniref:inositol monophosphatase family protein n=1 Tax=Streptomyces sp. ST2-7A TaxID=2907214 RepID=UPI001F4534FF|nr:inositol monophosphatase family protein [Streptomyces sp. ST2-7A]MCE7081596.1 inositol monophosphatase [Streptomyces sp. ST2-7A]